MKSFMKGSSILMIGDLLTKVISVLYLIPLARIDENIMLLMTNLLVPFSFFVVFSTLGINLILTNELVKSDTDSKKKKVLLDIGIIITTFTIISVIIMFMISPNLMNKIENNQQYINGLTIGSRFLTIGIILFSITAYLRSILLAYGDYKIISITYITEQVIKVGIILGGVYYALIYNSYDVVIVVYIIVLAILFSMITTLFIFIYHFIKYKYYKKFLTGTYDFEFTHIKYLIFSSIVLFSGGIYITLFDQIDLLLLNNQMINAGFSIDQINIIKSEYFTLSLKLVLVPITISSSFISVMIKQVGESKDNKDEINNIVYGVSLYSIFMFAIMMLLGNNIYEFFYAIPSNNIIVLQSLIIPMYIIKNVLGGYVFTNNGKVSSIFISTFAIIASKLFFDLVLFDKFLFFGYIISSIISLFIGITLLILMNKELFVHLSRTIMENFVLYLKGIILVIVNVLILKFIPSSFNLFFVLVIQAFLFIILYGLLFSNSIKNFLKK